MSSFSHVFASDGNIQIKVNPAKKAKIAVYLRIPGWVRNQPVPGNLYSYLKTGNETITIKVNGQPATYKTEEGYAVIDRDWKKGDVIEYNLPMNIHRVIANTKVEADVNKVTIERGPIVYCLEGIDNGITLGNMILPDDAELTATFVPGKLQGIEQITGEAVVFEPTADGLSITTTKRQITAIPYCVWDNRGADQMKVWIPRKITNITVAETPASTN